MPFFTMNDIEILVPLCANAPKYINRMKAFQKYGLLNTQDVKAVVEVLTGIEDQSLFCDGWNLPFNLVKGPFDQVSQKIYHYYATMKQQELTRSRWYIRVDDDSSTNIGPLVEWLDNNFDYREDHYFVTRMVWDTIPKYKQILVDMGYDHLMPKNNRSKNGGFKDCFIPHEWECSIASQGMMQRIVGNETSMEYIRRCSTYRGGYGDMGLAVGARLSGIQPAEAEVLTALADFHNYSGFAHGGDIHHVHFVAPDLPHWKTFVRWMERGYGG